MDTPNNLDIIKNNLAINTFIARKCIGLNHNELVEISGLTRPILSGIENARINPTLETIIRLSDSLNIEVDLMFFTKNRFEIIQGLLRSEFEKAKLKGFEIIISSELWKRLMKLSIKKKRNDYRKIIECIHVIVNFNFPLINESQKNKMVFIATLGFIYQEDGFRSGIEIGIWYAMNLYSKF